MVRKLTILLPTAQWHSLYEIPIGSKKWRPLGVTGPPKDDNYTYFHWAP